MVLYKYHPKHFYEVKNHPLSGITFGVWMRLLREHALQVDWHIYLLRVIFLTCMSLVNSFTALLDRRGYERHWKHLPLHAEPVFILGHPRTGTTHLHNLMSQDGRCAPIGEHLDCGKEFAYCTTFHVGFPSSFLSTEWLKGLLSPILSKTRPMDNMALNWNLPQEDELGTCQLTGGVSPYMPIMFMRNEEAYRPYYSFNTATKEAKTTWIRFFLSFCRKVTYRWGGCKPLLLKSPVHTARVELLLKLFPKARFIYIHRDPYEVFQSAAHMADAYYWYSYLQKPTDTQITEFILWQYQHLYECYMQDRALIPADQLHELSFSGLERDPLRELRGIYEKFGLGEFERIQPALEKYTASLADFKKNAHIELTPQMRELINERWGPSFDTFGYARVQ